MILIGIGGNLPTAHDSVRQTLNHGLSLFPTRGITLKALSNWYKTSPLGGPRQNDYINAVCDVDTELGPETLLAALHDIESTLGRSRAGKWGPRVIDLDLLDYRGQIIGPVPSAKKNTKNNIQIYKNTQKQPLSLPHPHIAERAFVLVPLQDIASNWRHPQTGEHVAAMLARLEGCRQGRILEKCPADG